MQRKEKPAIEDGQGGSDESNRRGLWKVGVWKWLVGARWWVGARRARRMAGMRPGDAGDAGDGRARVQSVVPSFGRLVDAWLGHLCVGATNGKVGVAQKVAKIQRGCRVSVEKREGGK